MPRTAQACWTRLISPLKKMCIRDRLSVGTLITLYVLGKRRPNENDDDEYDGEDDE